jgi:hypothetical protein
MKKGRKRKGIAETAVLVTIAGDGRRKGCGERNPKLLRRRRTQGAEGKKMKVGDREGSWCLLCLAGRGKHMGLVLLVGEEFGLEDSAKV